MLLRHRITGLLKTERRPKHSCGLKRYQVYAKPLWLVPRPNTKSNSSVISPQCNSFLRPGFPLAGPPNVWQRHLPALVALFRRLERLKIGLVAGIQFGVSPAALPSSIHFAISRARCASSSFGVVPSGSWPSGRSRLRISALFAIVEISL